MFLGMVVLPTVLPLIVGFVIGLTADAYPPRFYEVTAGVIPVLFLALAIDLRVFRLSYGKPKKWDENAGMRALEATSVLASWLIGSVLIALVLGEMISLLAVGNETSPGKIAQGVVLGGCFSGVAMIASVALSRERAAVSERAAVKETRR
jgi:hypothetical protein